MKVLVLGISGMLGKSIFLEFSRRKIETYGTLRTMSPLLLKLFGGYSQNIYENVHARDMEQIEGIITKVTPTIVVNCIGKIKQKHESNNTDYFLINSKFPRDLNILALKYHFKLIHFSTDCVFTGKKGLYQSTDIPDSQDGYGLSKYLGEVEGKNALTIRTSIIGFEIKDKVSLLEWVLSRDKSQPIEGHKKAIWSGFTTPYLASLLWKIVSTGKIDNLSGIIHLSSSPINKYDLLKIFNDVFTLDLTIDVNDSVAIDRSLVSSPEVFDILSEKKTHEEMIKDLLKSYEYNILKGEVQ